MFLLYVDESGNPKNTAEDYFVLGAMAIYETQAFFLSERIDAIQEKWFPSIQTQIEFHASHIFSGNEEPWHSISKEERKRLLYDLYSAISNASEKDLYLFGVAVHKNSFPTDDPVEKAFYELCGHFDGFIIQLNATFEKDGRKRERNRGLVILDSSKYRGHLDKLLLQYRKRDGTKFGRVKNFADAPTFADSKTTRLLQVADLVSYAIYKRYQYGDTSFFDILLPRFYQSDGILHGLMHQIARWRECYCPACMSRSKVRPSYDAEGEE